MSDEDWESGFAKSIAVYLNGQGIPDLDVRGQRVTDDSFVMCFNAHHEPIDFTLPAGEFGAAWQPVIDTGADASADGEPKAIVAGEQVMVDGQVSGRTPGDDALAHFSTSKNDSPSSGVPSI